MKEEEIEVAVKCSYWNYKYTITAVAQYPFSVKWACSRCGFENQVQVLRENKLLRGTKNVKKAEEFQASIASEARKDIQEIANKIHNEAAIGKYRTAELNCRCMQCKHKEPWSRLRYAKAENACLVSFLILYAFLILCALNQQNFPFFLLGTAAFGALVGAWFLVKIVHRSLVERAISRLPKSAKPIIEEVVSAYGSRTDSLTQKAFSDAPDKKRGVEGETNHSESFTEEVNDADCKVDEGIFHNNIVAVSPLSSILQRETTYMKAADSSPYDAAHSAAGTIIVFQEDGNNVADDVTYITCIDFRGKQVRIPLSNVETWALDQEKQKARLEAEKGTFASSHMDETPTGLGHPEKKEKAKRKLPRWAIILIGFGMLVATGFCIIIFFASHKESGRGREVNPWADESVLSVEAVSNRSGKLTRGTGFLFGLSRTGDGQEVLTRYSLVKDSTVNIFSNKGEEKKTVTSILWYDKANDLALLKISEPFSRGIKINLVAPREQDIKTAGSFILYGYTNWRGYACKRIKIYPTNVEITGDTCVITFVAPILSRVNGFVVLDSFGDVCGIVEEKESIMKIRVQLIRNIGK